MWLALKNHYINFEKVNTLEINEEEGFIKFEYGDSHVEIKTLSKGFGGSLTDEEFQKAIGRLMKVIVEEEYLTNEFLDLLSDEDLVGVAETI